MSTLPPECEQLLISGYVLGNLSSAEALLLEELMAENPELMEQVTAMQQALDLAYAPLEVTPPATLRERVLAAANSQRISPQAAKQSTATAEVTDSSTSRSRLPWNKILGAIALASIIGLSIINYRFWQTIQTAKVEVSKVNKRTYLLTSQDSPEIGTAKLVVNPNQLNATLIVRNLEPLPPEKVYALWTVVGKDAPHTTDEKGAILTTFFEVNKSSNLSTEIAVPQPYQTSETIKKIAITVEDKSAPQAHAGSILIATEDLTK